MLENVPSLGPFVYVRTMDLGGWYASCYIMIVFGVMLVALAVAMYKYLLKLFNGELLQGTDVTTVEIKAGPPYAPQEVVVPKGKTAVAASKLENSGLPKGVGDNAKAQALWDAQGKDETGDYFGQSFAKIRGNDMFGRAQDLPYRQQAGGNKKKPAYSTLGMEPPPAVAPMVTTDARPAGV